MNDNLAPGNKYHRLKSLSDTVERQELAQLEVDKESLVRDWEIATPVSKWHLAFPGTPMPEGEEHCGFETIEGTPQKVVYTVSDGKPRVWCYKVQRSHEKSVQMKTILGEVHSDDDEEYAKAVKTKHESASSSLLDRSKHVKAIDLSALQQIAQKFAAAIKIEPPEDMNSDESGEEAVGFAKRLQHIGGKPLAKAKGGSTVKGKPRFGSVSSGAGSSGGGLSAPMASSGAGVAQATASKSPMASSGPAVSASTEEKDEAGTASVGGPIKRRGRPPLRKTRDLSSNAEQALGPLEDKFSEFQGIISDCLQVEVDCNLSDEKSVKEFKQKMNALVKKYDETIKKLISWHDKKLSVHDRGIHTSIDQMKDDVDANLRALKALLSIAKWVATDKPNLNAIDETVATVRVAGAEFSAAILQKIFTWLTSERIRHNDFDGMTKFFEHARLAEEFNGFGAHSEHIAVMSLERTITNMIDGVNADHIKKDGTTLVTLQRCSGAIVAAGAKIVGWESSSCQMQVLHSISHCKNVPPEELVRSLAYVSDSTSPEDTANNVPNLPSKEVVEAQQALPILKALMTTSGGILLIDQARVVSGRRRREGEASQVLATCAEKFDAFDQASDALGSEAVAVYENFHMLQQKFKEVRNSDNAFDTKVRNMEETFHAKSSRQLTANF